MKLTNKHNHPEVVVRWAQDKLWKPQDHYLRVSELINPPLIRSLKMEHWDEIEVDVGDFLLAMYGEAWHAMLASYATKNELSEKILEVKIGDWTFKGQSDLVDGESELQDHKVTTVPSLYYSKDTWNQQINCYDWLWHKTGINIKSAVVNVFLRDWRPSELGRRTGYPHSPYYAMPMELWSHEDQEKFVLQRLALFNEAPTECTLEEKWAKAEQYAVWKKGNVKASKLLPNTAAANAYILKQKEPKKFSVKYRPPVCTRCKDYCDVRSVCPYNKEKQNG